MVKTSPVAMAVLCFLFHGCGQTETPVDSEGGSGSQTAATTAETADAAQSSPDADAQAGHGHPGGPPHGPGGPGGGRGQFGSFNPESMFERLETRPQTSRSTGSMSTLRNSDRCAVADGAAALQ